MLRKVRFLDPLNPLITFMGSYFIFILLSPLTNLFMGQLSSHKKTTLLYSLAYLLMFCIGFLSAQIAAKNPKNKLQKIDNQNITNFNIYIFLGLIGFLYLYVSGGAIPLLHETPESFRVSFARGKGEFILISTALLYYGNLKNIIANKTTILTFLKVIVSATFIMFMGWRSPALYFLVACFLATLFRDSFYLSKSRVKLKYILLPPVLLIFSSVIGLLRYGIQPRSILELTINIRHLFRVNFENFHLILTKFRSDDFFLGSSYLNDFLVMIPGLDREFTGNLLKKMLGMKFTGETMTITLPGEAYINFGFMGVFVFAAITGFVISFCNERLRSKNRINDRILLIVLNLFSIRIVTGGITPILIFTVAPILAVMLIDKLRIHEYSR
jgi:oligosaccharide repeat unit polymerase